MNSNELRSAYLGFFEARGHKIIPSASLIPHGDPTLLLTSAGMVQFKPYFLGKAVPPSLRAASCQKCFRTSDVEAVGDHNHLTFFEMLGNFSFGDYFKKEAISWAWEFVTDVLKLPKEKLWTTIYLDDDEAFGYWRKLDVPEDRIVRLGADNFWGPAGDSGPCGPSSEIHYDYGPEIKCDKPDCKPGCDCGRYTEIWNLVFPQFDQDKEGRRAPMAKPGIDTGMGLERTLAVLQGKRTVYETDAFIPLIDRVCELSGKRYGVDAETDVAIRVAAEHSRGIPFLIADGVLPSNEGRGYVLRRLLRRATLFGLRLGLDEPFLKDMAAVTMKMMDHVYPELVQRRDFVLKVIETEERKFAETRSTGLELVESIVGRADVVASKQISGADAFRLYDTYGFPIDLTREIAARRGCVVDLDGFKREMEQQREKARASHRFELAEKDAADLARALGIGKTVFTGYGNYSQNTVIRGILAKNEVVDSVEEGQEAGIILDSTPFYGEMGGQKGDTGEISSTTGRFSVADAMHITPEIIVHKGKMAAGSLSVGDNVDAVVDKERRLDIARNHTATHLLQAALRQVLGEHIQQRGSLVAPDRLRFDFSHLVPLSWDEIKKTNRLVNEMIRQNLPVYDEEMPYRQAIAAGTIAIFDEKYGEVVRVLRIGRPPISAELCGGTHVNATGDIGYFQMVSESSIGASLRRIEAVTGRGAAEYLGNQLEVLDKVAEILETEPDHLLERAIDIVEGLKNERKRTLILERELSRKVGESLLSQVQVVKGVNVVAGKVPSTRVEVLRELSDWLRDQVKSAVIVLGTVYEDRPLFLAVVTPDLVAKGLNAGNIIRQVAKVTGGGGGGKPNLAQAGGKDKEKLDEALSLVKELV